MKNCLQPDRKVLVFFWRLPWDRFLKLSAQSAWSALDPFCPLCPLSHLRIPKLLKLFFISSLTSPLPSRPPYLAARFLRPGQIICSEKLSTAQCDVVTNVHCEGGLPWGKSVVERCRTNYVRHVPPQGCVTAIQGLSFLLGEAYTHNVWISSS